MFKSSRFWGKKKKKPLFERIHGLLTLVETFNSRRVWILTEVQIFMWFNLGHFQRRGWCWAELGGVWVVCLGIGSRGRNNKSSGKCSGSFQRSPKLSVLVGQPLWAWKISLRKWGCGSEVISCISCSCGNFLKFGRNRGSTGYESRGSVTRHLPTISPGLLLCS